MLELFDDNKARQPFSKQARRKRVIDARFNLGEISAWCREAMVDMETRDNSQHWIFVSEGAGRVDWWPSTGRLVDDTDYSRPLFAGSWGDALEHLAARFY